MATNGNVQFTPAPSPRTEHEPFSESPVGNFFSSCARCRADAPLNAEIRELLSAHHMQLLMSFESWMSRQEDLVRKLIGQPLYGSSEPNADFIAAHPTLQPDCPVLRYMKNDPQNSKSNGRQVDSPETSRSRLPSKGVPRKCSFWSLYIESEDLKRRTNAERTARRHCEGSANAATRDYMPHWRRVLKTFVNSARFEIFFATIILTNSVLIGVEVEYMASTRPSTAPRFFYVLQHTCSAIFLLELMVRLAAHGFTFFYSADWVWNLLDVILVLCSLMEVIVDIIFVTGVKVNSVDNMSNLRIIRVMRMTRLIRSFRIPRIIRFVSALRLLVYSIVATLRSLVWAMILLVMITYVFGIAFTQATNDKLGDSRDGAQDADLEVKLLKYWGSLTTSIFTLYKSITGGISWHDVVDPLEEMHVMWAILFAAFISFSYFAVLNVITGVFCNSAIATATRDPDMVIHSLIAEKKTYMDNLKKLFKNVDADKSGLVTIHEFETLMTDDALQAHFAAMEIEPDDAWTLFKLIDKDMTNCIDIDEFVLGCMRLRGAAKGIDVALLLENNRVLLKRVAKLVYCMEQKGAMQGLGTIDRPETTGLDLERARAIALLTVPQGYGRNGGF